MAETIIYTKELDFIPKLQLSKSRRAVYYTFDDYTKGKIPKKYLENGLLKHPYRWEGKNLYNGKEGQYIVKNSKSVGKPRYWVINGQDIYSGKFSPKSRSGLMIKLHEYFKEIIKDCPKFMIKPNERYRLHLTWFILDSKVYPDPDNLWVYEKVINDVLVKDLSIVIDDSCVFTSGGSKNYEYRSNEGFKIEIFKV